MITAQIGMGVLDGGGVLGSVAVAQRLLRCNMDVNKALRTNETLRKDEWKQYDTAIIKAAQERLVGVADLKSRGLVYPVGNGLGKTVLEYEDMGDALTAQMSMDGVSRGKKDRPLIDIKFLPLPIIHADYQLNARVLAASRNGNSPLDTTLAEMAGRAVSEYQESMLFNGVSSFTYGGGVIYGYVDFPHRNLGSLTVGWDQSGATGETILADVLAMKQALINDLHYGPYMLYIPTAYETVLDDDFKDETDKPLRQRIKEVNGIIDIKVVDKLTSGVLLVQMTSDVVRMVTGLNITNVEWPSEGNMLFNYKVMTIDVPQIRAKQDNKCGIAHFS